MYLSHDLDIVITKLYEYFQRYPKPKHLSCIDSLISNEERVVIENNILHCNTISQIKSDESFKSEAEQVVRLVHDRDRILPEHKKEYGGDVSFKNGNWYNGAIERKYIDTLEFYNGWVENENEVKYLLPYLLGNIAYHAFLYCNNEKDYINTRGLIENHLVHIKTWPHEEYELILDFFYKLFAYFVQHTDMITHVLEKIYIFLPISFAQMVKIWEEQGHSRLRNHIFDYLENITSPIVVNNENIENWLLSDAHAEKFDLYSNNLYFDYIIKHSQ